MPDERAALDNQRFIFWFGPVASAREAMVWESETDGNPSVDADESNLPKIRQNRQNLRFYPSFNKVLVLFQSQDTKVSKMFLSTSFRNAGTITTLNGMGFQNF
jgi:hypothetical protein